MYRHELGRARELADVLKLQVQHAARANGHARASLAALRTALHLQSALGALLAIDDAHVHLAGLQVAQRHAAAAFDALHGALEAQSATSQPPEQAIPPIRGLSALQGVVAAILLEIEAALAAAPPDETREMVGFASPEQAEVVVALAHSEHRPTSVDEVAEQLTRALAPLGGMQSFVAPGHRVLVKPNLAVPRLADTGATTDPRLVAALVQLAYRAGARRVVVAESSRGAGHGGRVMEVTQVAELARQAGADLLDLQRATRVAVALPGDRAGRRVMVPAPLLESNVVINVPTAKTDFLDGLSGAIANWLGVLPVESRKELLGPPMYDSAAALLQLRRPSLNIMDALVVGEGDGPTATRGRFAGAILASTDPLAIDVVTASLLGLSSSRRAFLQVAARAKVGIADPGRIAVVGATGEPLDVHHLTLDSLALPRLGVEHYDANVIVGRGESLAGALGHFKAIADRWQQDGVWALVRLLRGHPTILVGDAADPLFEQHLRQGPYVAIGMAVPPHIREHPDVAALPDWTAGHDLEQQLLSALGVERTGKTLEEMIAEMNRVEGTLEYRSPIGGLVAALAAVPGLTTAARIAVLGLGVLLVIFMAWGAWSGVSWLRRTV